MPDAGVGQRFGCGRGGVDLENMTAFSRSPAKGLDLSRGVAAMRDKAAISKLSC